ncbi:MAG: hypothetical protein V3V00_16045 [Saprospiraceae bacterium]
MTQLAYNENMTVAFEGMIADAAIRKTDGTKIAVTTAIPFGRGVIKTIGEDLQTQLPNGTNNTVYGIAHSTQALQQSSLGVVEYAINDSVNILRQGAIWVFAEEAIDPDTDSVYCRYVAGAGGTVIGRFRTDVDTASASAVANCVFLTKTTGAGLVKVEINNP